MNFEVEWLEAPGVKDRVLAATWARLRIRAAGEDVVELVHLASDTRRSSVYGSTFPLVEWLTENWWHLLHEPSPTSSLEPGRGSPSWRRPWVQRHNLLAAREGMALPDAAFVRDGEEIVVCWFPDLAGQRVRFVGRGRVRVLATHFETAAATFINSTLERLSATVGDDEELRRVAAEWQVIQAADQQEQDLCRSLALLGVDPYDPDEADESLLGQVRDLNGEFPERLRNDLLEGTHLGALGSAVEWLMTNRRGLANGSAPHAYPTVPVTWAPSAHQSGYQVARRTRSELLGLTPDEPIRDLRGILVDRLGWDTNPVRLAVRVERSLQGLVGLCEDTVRPVVVVPGGREGWAERFLLARGAFFTATAAVGQGRLLTGAATRPQRAGRAFAAELLAPASALSKTVSGMVTSDEAAELAERFGVNPRLIEHQLKNHRIGYVAA